MPSTLIGACVHFHLCYHRNRIVLVKLGFVVCVSLTINTPFVHDLWLCWVSPFRQMIVAQKGALGRWHLIFTTSPETSKWELCFFTLCSRSALWHQADLAGDLPPITWIDLILFSLFLIFHITSWPSTSVFLHHSRPAHRNVMALERSNVLALSKSVLVIVMAKQWWVFSFKKKYIISAY